MTSTFQSNRGIQLGDRFGFIESSVDSFDIQVVMDMLVHGHSDGAVAYVLRGAVPTNLCERVGRRFRTLIDQRGSHREYDGYVKTNQIGSTQFDKGGHGYAEQTIAVQADMLQLFMDLSADEVTTFLLDGYLQHGFLASGVHFGPARFKSAYANHCTVRAWLDNGAMSLHPHEDISQIESAKLDGFEIESVRHTISFNMCVAKEGSGGEAVVWDLLPSPEYRTATGVYETGYPYPLEDIQEVRSFSLDLQQGDCYFLNASFLHGVRPSQGERVTAGRFIGAIADDRVVFWT